MKRRILLASFAMVSALSFGQTKLDLQLSSLARQGKVFAAKGVNNRQSAQIVTVIGGLAEGAAVPKKALEDMGIKVTFSAYGMVIMNVPMDRILELENLDEFTSLEANKPGQFMNYNSKVVDHVLELHEAEKAHAEGLPQAYNGDGVIVGTLDVGFDFNHVNFRDPVTHKSRFKEVILANGSIHGDAVCDENGKELSGAEALKVVSGEDIEALTSDTKYMFHGSHTLGTSAGCYDGDYLDKDGNVLYTNMKGAAYRADIVAAGMNCCTSDMTMTVTDEIGKYADSVGKPLVLSYSFGYIGDWMDGKNLLNKFFDNWTDNGKKPGRIVCFASGNDGMSPFTIHKELNESNDYTVKACVKHSAKKVSFDINIFNSNNADLDISYEILDKNLKVIRSLTVDEQKEYGILNYQHNSDHDNRTNATLKTRYLDMDGQISDNGEVRDSLVIITVKSRDRIACTPHIYSMYGVKAYPFYINNKLEQMGCTQGDAEASCSWFACSNSVLSVGAWTANMTSKSYLMPGEMISVIPESIARPINDIASFSSFIDKDDNDTSRPDFCAPGVGIISGINPYDYHLFDNNGNPLAKPIAGTETAIVGRAKEESGRQDGRSSYIGYSSGTSMATPNAAGIIALWLQANPQLTTNQVREVIRATADKDEFTAASPARFGAGKINALAGLKYILRNYPTAIHEVVNGEPKGLEEPMVKKVMENGNVIILKNGIKYNVAGQRM